MKVQLGLRLPKESTKIDPETKQPVHSVKKGGMFVKVGSNVVDARKANADSEGAQREHNRYDEGEISAQVLERQKTLHQGIIQYAQKNGINLADEKYNLDFVLPKKNRVKKAPEMKILGTFEVKKVTVPKQNGKRQ